MSPRTHLNAPTVEAAVWRAAEICDPTAENLHIAELVLAFANDDRAASSVTGLADELDLATRKIDPARTDPALLAAAAAAEWIARAEEGGEDPERVLRGGARLYFSGGVPATVGRWLGERGISV